MVLLKQQIEMKKVINGKLYNTETAKLLGSYWNGRTCGDFYRISEELYVTKKGAYFLAGEGGAHTPYARLCGNNSWCGGAKLRVLSEAEAKAWMEEHSNTEDYIAAFGTPEDA